MSLKKKKKLTCGSTATFKSDDFINCGFCSIQYHLSNIEMTTEFFDALNLKRSLGILWKCAECLKSKDDISQVKKDMNIKLII